MPFYSLQPDIKLPTDITIWKWLFGGKNAVLSKHDPASITGYTDASTKERIPYSSVKEYSTYISTALVKNYGLKEDDTVALFSSNSVWYPVIMYATLRVGGKVSGASPAYNTEEMTYALKTGHAKFLMTMLGSIEITVAAAKAAGIPKDRIFLLEGKIEGFKNVKDLLEMGKKYSGNGQAKPFELPMGKTNGDVCGFISFSSGTTGFPKAVMISHQNVIAQCLQIQQITPNTHRKVLAILPSFHITGLVHILHLPILLNAEVYFLPTFSMKSMLDTIVEYQIGQLILVPPIIIRLVQDPIVDEYDLRHITTFSSGAAPLSLEILGQLQKKFPNTGFKQGYGMTESCSCITAHPPEKYDYNYAHTVGTVVASTIVKILDEDGKELSVNQPGEIAAKGPQITMGYLNNSVANAETWMPDGFLKTGDQGMIDDNGVITITDRIKEMIKVKGIGVAPAELEDLLLSHPYVEDVAVLSIQDEYSGERPKAYVVKKAGTPHETHVGQALLKYVQEKKVRYKWVKEIEFSDEIPKSATGKILRRVLRDKERSGKRGIVVKDKNPKARF